MSIRERIERQMARKLATVSGVGAVVRWDGRGVLQVGDEETGGVAEPTIVMKPQLEQVLLKGPQFRECVLTLEVAAIVPQPENGSGSTSALFNDWLARMQAILYALDHLVEDADQGNEEPLAVSTEVSECDPPDIPGGLVAATVSVQVTYQTDATSPYTGPGITLYQE